MRQTGRKVVIMENSKKNNIQSFLLLYLAFMIYSGTTVCSKFAAMQQGITLPFLFFLGMEVFCLGVYAIIWQQVLKKVSLITAMANKGVVVIFGLIWSVLLFHETVSVYNILGTVLIIFGIWMVSTDE